MIHLTRRAALAVGAATGLAALAGRAVLAQPSHEQILVDRAALAVEEFLADSNMDLMRPYMQHAQAVLVFPELLKGAIFFGVQGGPGVMLVRDETTGAWSSPAFYYLLEGSLGLQFGGSATSVVITVMNRPAIDKILTSKFKLGTDARVAVGPIGTGVGAATTARFGEDLYTFARSKGLFMGLSLDGAGILPNNEANAAYYGAATTPARILRGEAGPSPGAQALRDALSRF
jgi:lipid-binding SYLF domain-containing protein